MQHNYPGQPNPGQQNQGHYYNNPYVNQPPGHPNQGQGEQHVHQGHYYPGHGGPQGYPYPGQGYYPGYPGNQGFPGHQGQPGMMPMYGNVPPGVHPTPLTPDKESEKSNPESKESDESGDEENWSPPGVSSGKSEKLEKKTGKISPPPPYEAMAGMPPGFPHGMPPGYDPRIHPSVYPFGAPGMHAGHPPAGAPGMNAGHPPMGAPGAPRFPGGDNFAARTPQYHMPPHSQPGGPHAGNVPPRMQAPHLGQMRPKSDQEPLDSLSRGSDEYVEQQARGKKDDTSTAKKGDRKGTSYSQFVIYTNTFIHSILGTGSKVKVKCEDHIFVSPAKHSDT